MACSLLPGRGAALTGPIVHSEDFETDAPDWVLEAPWAVTEEDSVSGTKSLSDSPGVNYGNNVNKSARVTLDFTTVSRPVLTFQHRYNLEDYKDFGYVEASVDGATWKALFFVTGFSGTNWLGEAIDLGEYAFRPRVSIRFRVVTNASVAFDGWYVDDVEVVNNTATLPYPFFDNMEAAGSEDNWIAATWRRVAGTTFSGIRQWTDSPGGGSVNGVTSALVLAGPMDLSAAINPQLSFWHRIPNRLSCCGQVDRQARVDVSVDGGLNWANLRTLTYVDPPVTAWSRVQLDLSPYVGLSAVRLRFTFADPTVAVDGWYIDDVRIDDACPNVNLNPPTNVTEHSMDLSWTLADCADFAQYELYRSTTPGVGRTSELVATFTDKNQTSYSDTNLKRADTTYYYRVFVTDTQSLYNQGSNPVSAKTLDGITPIPLGGGDDMEMGDKWGHDLPWGLVMDPAACHAGTRCWHDSPTGPYANNEDIALTTRLNLGAGGRPLFKFWHRYNLEDYKDFGYVEVSTDKVSWKKLFFATGFTGTTWRAEEIDLSEYAFQTIWLRFRLVTDGQTVFDGWHIDDVEVVNNDTAILSCPFSDDAESDDSEQKWISSTWRRKSGAAHGGVLQWTDSPDGGSVNGVTSALALAGSIDLRGTANPQLSFWHRIPNRLSCCGAADRQARVDVSVNGGLNWANLRTFTYVDTPVTAWTRVQLDLSAYVGLSAVRLRFTFADPTVAVDGWYIDDVSISCDLVTTTSSTSTSTSTSSSSSSTTSSSSSTSSSTTTSTSSSTSSSTTTSTSSTTSTRPDSIIRVRDCQGVPGGVASCEIELAVAEGVQIATVAFKATAEPKSGTPPLESCVDFVHDPALPPHTFEEPQCNDAVGVGWALPISPALTGTVVLGTLKVSLPSSVQDGHGYQLRIQSPSASSNGTELVPIVLGTEGMLGVERPFRVCDVMPRGSDLNGDGDTDDAGEFGNGVINNADVVAIFRASLELAPAPPTDSDRFSGMDAVSPGDIPPNCGGDGILAINDVVVCFRRSLVPTEPSYERRRAVGTCVSRRFEAPSAPTPLRALLSEPSSALGTRVFAQLARLAGAVVPGLPRRAGPGDLVELPVRLRLLPGSEIATFQFAAGVVSRPGAPSLAVEPEFVHAGSHPPPQLMLREGPDLLLGWLQAIVRLGPRAAKLGALSFRLPATARAGDEYLVEIRSPSGLSASGEEQLLVGGNVRLSIGDVPRRPRRPRVRCELGGEGRRYVLGVAETVSCWVESRSGDGAPATEVYWASDAPEVVAVEPAEGGTALVRGASPGRARVVALVGGRGSVHHVRVRVR